MKLVFILLILLGCSACSCHGTPDGDIYEYDHLLFYYEILFRVEQPLAFDIWIGKGESLFLDKTYYTEWTEHMERFLQDSRNGRLLSKDVFFAVLIKSHQLQALGLYDFLVKPPAWQYFVQNACWARQHTHPHMFVYAFTRAVLERGSHARLLPFIYEILPGYFFDWHLVNSAQQFIPSANGSLLHKLSTMRAMGAPTIDWGKPWQWWKMLGLSVEYWYTEPEDVVDSNIREVTEYGIRQHEQQVWWKPDDYTRNFIVDHDYHGEQRSSILSYLTEDADWNAYWQLVSVNYSPIIGGFSSNWKRVLYAEHWYFFLEKFLARYYLERLTHGFGAIPDFDWNNQVIIKDGYDPQLVALNKQRFIAREPEWRTPSIGNAEQHSLRETIDYIKAVIDAGRYTLRNGTQIDLREPKAFSYIMELLRGHTDPNGNFIESYWYSLVHMHFANATQHHQINQAIAPHVNLNFETMARDPFFYVFHKELVKLRYRFQSYLPPYTRAELQAQPGVSVLDANVTKLMTYDSRCEFDVSNLLRTNFTFKVGGFLSHHSLLARRACLNHRPFVLHVTIKAEQHQKLLLRFFIAPKYDEFGRAFSLEQNRRNFIELTNVERSVHPGINQLDFSYKQIFIRKPPKTYYCTVSPRCRGNMLLFADEHKNCGLPERLLLPRGWPNGLPMQLFIMAIENDASVGAQLWWRPCLFRVGKRSLGYPFDRHIPNEREFLTPNMLIKDVKIFHENWQAT